ncbi:hypothetical protein SAMN04515674_105354 [Pseudarcicella hirudinis]|uniref:Uncharacterized protein n=1 Tax=Pseudarcicella hirudinis TaxID=1079859 RepID=A0A1I5T4Y0_9BACT|nr:hypothetical protein [Pseudarcicella hirudinis]SFP77566.1 hypothetical protein SAMN04515674_105354 [Pseudarcicella hirudinis]
MKIFQNFVLISIILFSTTLRGQINLKTNYSTISINGKGFITSIKDKITHKEYCPKGRPSSLLNLHSQNKYLEPQSASFNPQKGEILLNYSNGSVAKVKLLQKKHYLRFELVSLTNREQIDNIVWGPYKTNISKTIGDIISVVRSDDFAIGMLGLNDNTTSGPPNDGDMSFMYYYIHSPDPKKYPLPPHLKEGQTFKIGGDGISDIAFYSQPEEYFRMCYGNGALLEPEFGSSICMHSRNRRKEQMINFPVLPDNVDGGFNSARHQLVVPTNADFIGSAIALYACPDTLGLATIEKIVLNEGLPHPEVDGKWIKDPKAYKPDIAWWGAHDSLSVYASQLGLNAVQDEGLGEYYPNPANRWAKKKIQLNNYGLDIPEFGAIMQKNGIRYGLHTLCEFLQPHTSDVSPTPNDSLAIMMRTHITRNLLENDSIITVADTSYFHEFGGWEGNHTNVLKIGKELIEYTGITKTQPYTFLGVKRGFHGTTAGSYQAGTTIVKLQPNCYRGFAPDMNLQEVYADYYGRLLTDGKMDYIDFDGLESCIYQGHGQYSFKRFFRKLFDSYKNNGGQYLRVMGSCVYEGNWHYMSVCNVGGGDHMFSPVLNKWGIEGKDMRYVFESNYFPATFGIINFSPAWSLYDAENLQAKSIGWNATYMLGLSQETVEKSAEKQAIFKAYRTWENARAANVFSPAHKKLLKDLNYKFHLEEKEKGKFALSVIRENRFMLYAAPDSSKQFNVFNEFDNQPLQFSIRLTGNKNSLAAGVSFSLNQKTYNIPTTISEGQFLIAEKGRLYLTDRNRKKLKEITNVTLPSLPSGKHIMQWQINTASDKEIKLEVVVSTFGKTLSV